MENEIPVEMTSEECPYCVGMVPLGTLSGHILVCEDRPQERTVEKVIVKEIPVRMHVPEHPRPSGETMGHYTMSHYYSRNRYVDVNVRRIRDWS